MNENVPCEQNSGKGMETGENISSRRYFSEVSKYLRLM